MWYVNNRPPTQHPSRRKHGKGKGGGKRDTTPPLPAPRPAGNASGSANAAPSRVMPLVAPAVVRGGGQAPPAGAAPAQEHLQRQFDVSQLPVPAAAEDDEVAMAAMTAKQLGQLITLRLGHHAAAKEVMRQLHQAMCDAAIPKGVRKRLPQLLPAMSARCAALKEALDRAQAALQRAKQQRRQAQAR